MTYSLPNEQRQEAIDALRQIMADDGELISDVVVISKVMGVDGELSVRCIQTTGTDWLTRRVMLDVAHSAELDFS